MDRYYIKSKRILIGDDLTPHENAGILIENGKICKILERISELKYADTDKVFDYDNCTIMPGLIDCHNHLALDTRLENHLQKMEDCESEQTIRALRTMQDDLYSGVTTSRCCGDRYYIDVICKKNQREGNIIGPKLIVSGIGMRALHGHGYVGMPFNGPDEFAKQARQNILNGVDFLKVFMTKVINATSFINHFMTLDELKAVVEVAKSVDKKTACHCTGGQGLDDCLDAGIDCIEHVYYISRKQIERVFNLNRWVVYTPSYALNNELLFKFSPKDKEGSLKEQDIIIHCLRNAIAAGLNFGIGTDGIHGGLAQEACYISELGANNIDVLKGITIQAAKLCGVSENTGSISEGKAADLIIVDGNPMEDIASLKKIRGVIQDGKVIR